uniref:Uncharacterized protein n=1 Tax=Helianthus annuus TaxID=4232 RepID=A0A251TSV5_HELAN
MFIPILFTYVVRLFRSVILFKKHSADFHNYFFIVFCRSFHLFCRYVNQIGSFHLLCRYGSE